MQIINVGLIGFGLAGRAFHAQVISRVPGLRLAAILQRHGDEASAAYPDATIVRSSSELLAIPDLRLIVIATPNDSHYALAQECLAAGKDVVVDKPFTVTLRDAISLVEQAKKVGRLITVFQNRRFDGDFQSIQEVLRSGVLGRVVYFETNYDRYRPKLRENAWREASRAGSGIFFDLGPHLIDHALSLFGIPVAVTADIRAQRNSALVDDAFTITLHYSGGMRAQLSSIMLAAAPRPRFILYGTEGAFVRQHFDAQEERLRCGTTLGSDAWTTEPEEKWSVLSVAEGDTISHRHVPPGPGDYRAFYANVRDAMLGQAELTVTPQQALEVMRALELGRESSLRGCALPWPKND
ncbi:MAG TPA: oxidoreductase [Candidatus Acidoferrum sp.]